MRSPRSRRDIPSATRLPRGCASGAALGFAWRPYDRFAFVENEEARQAYFATANPRTETMRQVVRNWPTLYHGPKAVFPSGDLSITLGSLQTYVSSAACQIEDFNFS
jgi:hypothetical protein